MHKILFSGAFVIISFLFQVQVFGAVRPCVAALTAGYSLQSSPQELALAQLQKYRALLITEIDRPTQPVHGEFLIRPQSESEKGPGNAFSTDNF